MMTEKSILPASWNVPQIFRDRLGAKVGRQRPMVAEGHVLLVLHAPPKPDETERIGRFFWRTPDGNWTSKDLGSGVNILNKHLDEYENAIAGLDRREEEATTADEYFSVLDTIAPLQRAARNLHHVLQEARLACPDYRELINARDRAYEIERNAELLYAAAKNGLDVVVARRAEDQAHSSRRMAVAAHRLNLLAAFFFPIVTLTTIFGVNLQHGFEDRSPPLPFLAVIALGLILGGILTLFVIQRGSNSNSRKPRGERRNPIR